MGIKSTRPLRILLVDDDEDVRSTLRLVLESDGHEVVEVGDGLEALNLATADDFHLVVTDYVMPGMSGDQLALELKKRFPTRPVIMISANADLLPSPVPGVDCMLAKPFQVKDLLRAVGEASAVALHS